MSHETRRFVLRRTFLGPTLAAVTSVACAETGPTARTADAGSLGPLDAALHADARASSPAQAGTLAACVALSGSAPRGVADVVALINELPAPASLPCLVASLPRPLSLVASVSASSAQPADDANSPRIFILFDAVTLSVVPTGVGKDLLEFGEWVTPLRSTKGELAFPVSRPVADDAPYLRVAGEDGTPSQCGFCHPSQVHHPTIDHAFVSDALRVARYYEQPVDELRRVREACDLEDAPQCELLRALFDHGEVRQGAFDPAVRMGF